MLIRQSAMNLKIQSNQFCFLFFVTISIALSCEASVTVSAEQLPVTAQKDTHVPLSIEKQVVVGTGLKDLGIFSDLDNEIQVPLFKGANKDNILIAINKHARTLSALVNGIPIKTYPIALGFSPIGDKEKEGDGKTPEGIYSIVEMKQDKLPKKYGARSMLLSYPNIKDAERGCKKGIITTDQKSEIISQTKRGNIPLQTTALGSSIRIHGGGIQDDWTLGCIAMRDEDIIELFEVVRNGTQVIVAKDIPQGLTDSDKDGIPDPVDIVMGALKVDVNNAYYDDKYYPISSNKGDVPRDRGCCSDVIIRSLRNAGIDLQSVLQKDIRRHPDSYPNIKKPNSSIDHRRVKNLLVYFKRHFEEVDVSERKFMPGDILLFDTLLKQGPDHIGIVSSFSTTDGTPLIINNWTYGSVTDSMDLLSFVPVTHQFRAPHIIGKK